MALPTIKLRRIDLLTYLRRPGQYHFCVGAANELLDKLDGDCGGLAATNAQAGNATLAASLLERVDQGNKDTGPTGADRVTERRGTAVNVDLVVADAEILQREHGDAVERLVHFPQVDIADLPTGLVEHLVDRADGG